MKNLLSRMRSDHTISKETNCFEHACEHRPTFVGELSSEADVTTLNEDSSDSISIVYQTATSCGFSTIYYFYSLRVAVFCNPDGPLGCAT